MSPQPGPLRSDYQVPEPGYRTVVQPVLAMGDTASAAYCIHRGAKLCDRAHAHARVIRMVSGSGPPLRQGGSSGWLAYKDACCERLEDMGKLTQQRTEKKVNASAELPAFLFAAVHPMGLLSI